MSAGIETRHGARCPKREDASKRCNGKGCSHRAQVYVKGKREKGPWGTLDEAKSWRVNRQNEVAKGAAPATSTMTVAEAWASWMEKAKAGTLRTRSGDAYKPAAIRGYDGTMRTRFLPDHGSLRLAKVDRAGLQRFVESLVAKDVSPSSIRNTINGLRVLYRDAEELVPGGVHPDPTVGLRLPAVRQGEKRKVSVPEVHKLMEALPETERPIWGVFFYAGLRLGEVRALRWQDVDLQAQVIDVPHGWDKVEGRINPKSRSGVRRVPMPAGLKELLEAHEKRAADTSPGSLVFGKANGDPFTETTVHNRATAAWKTAKLERLTPHEARHAYAALMIAAGVSLKALSEYMGHASITITADRYAYLLEGTEALDAQRLDALLAA